MHRSCLFEEIEKLLKKNLVPATKEFIQSCKGGKRIRGTLVKLGFELTGKKSEEIIKIGAAYEIFHAAILIHDDIMDQSIVRRGKPSLHKRVGVAKAITLADYGFFLALQIIAESNFFEKSKIEALKLFARVAKDTAVGQIMDLEGLDPITTAKLKTAHYTISGPLQLGAILAGGSTDLIKVLGLFGENLGIAFQFQDDILDGQAERNVQQQAEHYATKAKKIIGKITQDVKMRKLLGSMADFVIERSK